GCPVDLFYWRDYSRPGPGLWGSSYQSGSGSAVVNSALAGSDVIMVAGGATSLDYWLMSRPEIKKAEQLKGGSVAISNFGAASDFVARYALDKIGLTPGKDVTIVQAGGISDR